MLSSERQGLIDSFRSAEAPPTTVEEWREAWDAMTLQVPLAPGANVTEADAGGDGPVVEYLHGGAFGIGAPRNVAGYLSRLAVDTGGQVLGVDYRLAPSIRSPPHSTAPSPRIAGWWQAAPRPIASCSVMTPAARTSSSRPCRETLD